MACGHMLRTIPSGIADNQSGNTITHITMLHKKDDKITPGQRYGRTNADVGFQVQMEEYMCTADCFSVFECNYLFPPAFGTFIVEFK